MWSESRRSRLESTLSFREWLEDEFDRVPYTVLRADFSTEPHSRRLEAGCRELFGFEVDLTSRLRDAVEQMELEKDAAVCVAACRLQDEVELHALCRPSTPLDDVPAPVSVKLVHGRRSRPELKLSSWCRERRAYEEENSNKNTDSIVLFFDDLLLEGLTSNVAIVTDRRELFVPDRDVLPGIGMQLAVEAARSLGITVRKGDVPLPRELGGTGDISNWKEVFLTNANQLCVPVKSIHRDGRFSLAFDNFHITRSIRESMLQKRLPRNHLPRATCKEAPVERDECGRV